ncbi:MAG TPA: isocitrate lyase/phosphoenolpyruvate mutase family protein [Stellaceae bacterium]|nr:isocitrate lyase/phosphoenolpyruvate mutase family protein [Stellaceae bacterium]
MSATPGKADKFRALHREFLILPNAWDPGSARLIESCGASAIATTSSGLGWSNGYPDGNAIPVAVLGRAVAAIARAIAVPLSVDIEGGYADAPDTVGKNVAVILDNGGVGINLEDGNDPPDLMLRKIAAARAAGQRAGVALFINARTDVYLHALVPKERMIEESIARAARYGAAGCDGIFVPGAIEPDAIRAIAAAVAPLPFNAMMRPGLPAAETLKQLGVRRLSAGGGIAMAAISLTQRLAKSFLATGDSNELAAHIQGITYPGLNALFRHG